MKHRICLIAATVILVVGSTYANAQMVRQQGVFGRMGIETPAMRSARQQTAIAMQNRAKAEAAQDAVGDMLGVVRDELKLSIDEIKTEAVESARMLEEAKVLREKALAMTAEAEKAMADARAARTEADKITADARQSVTQAADLQKAVDEMKAATEKQIAEYRAGVEQLKKEREEFEKAKREHEEQKNKDQKEQQVRLDALNAKLDEKPQPVVEEEASPESES